MKQVQVEVEGGKGKEAGIGGFELPGGDQLDSGFVDKRSL